MTGPEQNIHCPHCGSRNVECISRPRHKHQCHDCGFDGTAASLVGVDAELFAEAIRGWLLSKHIPFDQIDAWADEVAAIAADHPPWRMS